MIHALLAYALTEAGGQAAPIASAPPADVKKSVRLKPGTYRLTAPMVVSGSNLVLDGGGATLRGNGTGVGIQIGKGQNVTIKNLKITGFRWGIVADGTTNLKMIGVDSSGNANHFEAMEGKIVMDMEGGKEPDYGGGLLLRKVTGGTLQGVQAHGQWNGLTLSGSRQVTIEKCDFSKNDDTGLHLWGSSNNMVRDNRITWVGIGIVKSGAFVHKGGDQAGILLEHDSNKNEFHRNNLVHCVGDGVFLRANELAPVPAAEARKQGMPTVGEEPVLMPTHPSNDNLFQENDASFAEDANAFESDFCSGNKFIENVASYSNYGFWLGFSRNTIVRGNVIVGNKAHAVQLDNGWNNSFEGNTVVRDNGSPVAFYFSDEEANAAKPNHGAQNRSGNLSIFDTLFVGYTKPFKFVQTNPVTVQANTLMNVERFPEEQLAEVTGPMPLFVNNEFERHTSPDLIASLGEVAIVPTAMDTVGGVTVTRLAANATEAVVLGSLTGRFDGEEFELGRVKGVGTVSFPPRLARFVHVRGAANNPASFLLLMGDQSLAKRALTEATSGQKLADLAVDGDWDTPEKSWRPSEEPGQWFQVDLPRLANVNGFAIASNVVNPHDFWSKFHIVVSDSGLFQGEERTVVTETDWDRRPGPVRVYRIDPVRARYVRIVGDVGQKWVQLQEFSVFGKPIVSD